MQACPRCDTRMSNNDETTKLTEYVCPKCHTTRIVKKAAYRVTASGSGQVTAADD